MELPAYFLHLPAEVGKDYVDDYICLLLLNAQAHFMLGLEYRFDVELSQLRDEGVVDLLAEIVLVETIVLLLHIKQY